MSINSVLKDLTQGVDISEEMAYQSFNKLFTGELTPAQTGAFLMGLKAKGETPYEIKAAVQAALEQARVVEHDFEQSIDTCGTGGDGKNSFNCSTAVSLYLADMGYKVFKHGNKAVSSSCGSAEVVEHLNLPFLQERKDIEHYLHKIGFAFLFAPNFHPAFAQVAPLRKELGIPTLFNLMGPLLNPARPNYQLLGVGDKKHLLLIADVLHLFQIKHAAVVHGAEGFDEITPCGTSEIAFVDENGIRQENIHPREFDIPVCKPADLACPDTRDSLHLMHSILQGKGPEAIKNMVILNLGMSLYLLEEAYDLETGMHIAGKKLEQGIDMEKLHAG